MRIRFVGRMPSTIYSGGRLLALTMAESMATTGAEVDFLVDAMPVMYEEFRLFSRMSIQCADFNNLSPLANRSIDVVVVVPNQGNLPFHSEWVRHGLECNARIVLLNFESPNWFNEVSPFKRNVDLWAGWDVVSEYANMILSISGEGSKYAEVYYNNAPRGCLFDFSYPAINTRLADEAEYSDEREKRIVLLTRVDPHKGFNNLDPLIHKDLAGYKVSVFLGMGTMPPGELKSWRQRFNDVGMEFEVCPAIIGKEKFAMLKSASLLYFPSRFEGFGIPPLEAAYCMLPCACSDLPVLKEFGRKAFVYGRAESPEDMHRAVRDALETGADLVAGEHERISEIADMEEYGRRLERLFGMMA